MTQDRFKFRAWDKINKRLWHVVSPDFLLEDCLIGYSKNEGDSGIGWKMQITDLEIMQCTGLRDKNGTLIFEGDIVNFEGRLIVIKWNIENKERFDGERSSTTYVGFSLGLYGLYGNSFSECEIIGNIQEHPHLMKEK